MVKSFRVGHKAEYSTDRITYPCMFETKPFESKAQPDIQAFLRQSFKQLSEFALFYGPPVRLYISESANRIIGINRHFSGLSADGGFIRVKGSVVSV